MHGAAHINHRVVVLCLLRHQRADKETQRFCGCVHGSRKETTLRRVCRFCRRRIQSPVHVRSRLGMSGDRVQQINSPLAKEYLLCLECFRLFAVPRRYGNHLKKCSFDCGFACIRVPEHCLICSEKCSSMEFHYYYHEKENRMQVKRALLSLINLSERG